VRAVPRIGSAHGGRRRTRVPGEAAFAGSGGAPNPRGPDSDRARTRSVDAGSASTPHAVRDGRRPSHVADGRNPRRDVGGL